MASCLPDATACGPYSLHGRIAICQLAKQMPSCAIVLSLGIIKLCSVVSSSGESK